MAARPGVGTNGLLGVDRRDPVIPCVGVRVTSTAGEAIQLPCRGEPETTRKRSAAGEPGALVSGNFGTMGLLMCAGVAGFLALLARLGPCAAVQGENEYKKRQKKKERRQQQTSWFCTTPVLAKNDKVVGLRGAKRRHVVRVYRGLTKNNKKQHRTCGLYDVRL
jgi:hypothetical protein